MILWKNSKENLEKVKRDSKNQSTFSTEPKLITYLSEFGFEKVAGSGYVIHHFDDAGITHYIEGGKTK